MPIVGIDHVNIRTPDPARAIAFYRDVLGMTASITPGLDDPARGGWMLDEAGHAAVHIGHAALPYPSDGAVLWRGGGEGAVHHVALTCTDRPALEARLAASGVAWTENRVPQIGLTQLFVPDPDGVLLELNFHEP